MAAETDKSGHPRFWQARCGARAKGLMILVLSAAFLAQSVLVYSDTTRAKQLSQDGIAGRQVWQRNNCQSCHQLHGFGGFLGPDLTNASERLEREQLDALLTQGRGQMPAFALPADDIDAIWQFLRAMNETGRGQARNPSLGRPDRDGAGRDSPSALALNGLIDESGDDRVAQGYEVFRTGTCMACHTLYARSAVGAPDLSLSGNLLSPDEIMAVLENGRPPRMPPPALSADDRDRLQAFIMFLAEHRADALARVARRPGSFWTSLPWWEY